MWYRRTCFLACSVRAMASSCEFASVRNKYLGINMTAQRDFLCLFSQDELKTTLPPHKVYIRFMWSKFFLIILNYKIGINTCEDRKLLYNSTGFVRVDVHSCCSQILWLSKYIFRYCWVENLFFHCFRLNQSSFLTDIFIVTLFLLFPYWPWSEYWKWRCLVVGLDCMAIEENATPLRNCWQK